MIERTNLRSLREIVSEYPVVLIDTSVLSNYFRDEKNFTSIEEKEIVSEEGHQFRVVLTDYVKRKTPCFITSLVSEEYLKGSYYPYKKIIRKKGVQQNRKVLNLCRKIRDSKKEIRRLVNTFYENNRILELTKNEHNLYNIFYKTYSKLPTLYELSDVDTDFLISGIVIAQTREFSALISNDFGIVRAWKHIRRRENISSDQFGFAVRVGIDNFKILY